jgi:hypothetical protein
VAYLKPSSFSSNGFCLIRLLSSRKFDMNLTVPLFFFGMINDGVAQSERFTVRSTPIRQSLSTSTSVRSVCSLFTGSEMLVHDTISNLVEVQCHML